MNDIQTWIKQSPKAELHLHIEGTLEPALMFKFAQRNGVKLPFESEQEIKQAYLFKNLPSFLDLYYQSMQVLIHEQDFYDLTMAYLNHAKSQNTQLVEFFFDPQAHLHRGISFDVVINGIYRATLEAEREYGIKTGLIMCFLRDLPEKDAWLTLNKALDHKEKIIAVGLDSAEINNPPKKFLSVFKEAKKQGFELVAHAGEEGPPEYIWQALDYLGVSRIDHGVRCLEDKELIKRLVKDQIPLTVCPLSNLKLQVVDQLSHHPLRQMLLAGLKVTVNSDDPAFFGGYLNENLIAAQSALNLTQRELVTIIQNGFDSAFIATRY